MAEHEDHKAVEGSIFIAPPLGWVGKKQRTPAEELVVLLGRYGSHVSLAGEMVRGSVLRQLAGGLGPNKRPPFVGLTIANATITEELDLAHLSVQGRNFPTNGSLRTFAQSQSDEGRRPSVSSPAASDRGPGCSAIHGRLLVQSVLHSAVLSGIFAKLQVADRAQAVLRAREAGLGD